MPMLPYPEVLPLPSRYKAILFLFRIRHSETPGFIIRKHRGFRLANSGFPIRKPTLSGTIATGSFPGTLPLRCTGGGNIPAPGRAWDDRQASPPASRR